jgi:hypothetical protein
MKKTTALLTLAFAVAAGPAPAFVWAELGDAGELPGTAQAPVGAGSLTSITGGLAANDTDMFLIHIFDLSAFTASTVGTTFFDTQLWLFDSAGYGVTFNDDDVGLQSTLTNAFVPSTGNYYLALSRFDRDALDGSGNALWLDTPFNAERPPDGPGAANPLDHWSGSTDAGSYGIHFAGVDATVPIPEPAPLALLGLGLGALALGTRRRRARAS